MGRPGWLAPLLALAMLASCVTFAFPPQQAQLQLSAMARPAFPSFQGAGSFTMENSRGKFTGLIHLALQDELFSLEIADVTGRSLMAVAGSAGRLVRLDMATGKKEVYSGHIPLLGGISAPAELVRIMVTGAPPSFAAIRATREQDGWKVASVTSPDMDIYYNDGKLTRVTGGTGPMAYELELGPMAPGPMAEYVESARIKFQGARLAIQWEQVRQGEAFADGFFDLEQTGSGKDDL